MDATMTTTATTTDTSTALGKRLREKESEIATEDVDTAIAPAPEASEIGGIATAETVEELLNSREHYEMRKRVPIRSESTKDDVYVTRNARFGALRARCRQRLDKSKRVVVHGLGAAVSRACDVALAVQNDSGGRVTLQVKTGSLAVFDDYMPLKPGLPMVTKKRIKSVIHVTITANENYI